jgi:hypothetical protein
MSVQISPTESNSYLVNNKEVYQDQSGVWIAKEELLPSELSAWKNYMDHMNGEKNSNPLELKPQQIQELKNLDEIIEKLNKQISYLPSNKHISAQEREDLKAYYEGQKTKYSGMRTNLINAFPVTYQIVQAGAIA